jgi:hypothetical protein
MRVHAYLSIVSDEATIRAIHVETRAQNATIKPLKARNDPPASDILWSWATARVSLDADDVDNGLRSLLSTHRPIFPAIRKHSEKSDIYLQMVTYYEAGEEPRGLYLSAETISLLAELGAALDNDIAQTLEDRSASPIPTTPP